MSASLLVNALVLVAVLVWMGARQLTWQPVNLRRMWVLPLVLLGVGAIVTVNTGRGIRIDAPSVGLLALEVVIGTALGVAMGWIARFRRLDTPVRDRRGDVIAWQYRTGWVGAVLWVALIAIRIGIDAGAAAAGLGGLLTSTGVILAVVGVNRLANSAVLHYRFHRSSTLAPAA